MTVLTGVVAAILPVDAPAGTVNVNLEAFTRVKVAMTPLRVTLERPVRLEPATVTTEPAFPTVGEKFVITGGDGTRVKLI